MKEKIFLVLLLFVSVSFAVSPTAKWEPSGWSGGGNVATVDVDPKNPNILWAGSDIGGPFKSINKGDYWVLANKGYEDDSVISMAIDPVDSNKIYAMGCAGLYKTVNGLSGNEDVAWARISPNNFIYGWNFNPCWYWNRLIAVNPKNTREIFVGSAKRVDGTYVSGGGLWKATENTDGSYSWQHINSFSSSGPDDVDISTVVIDPADPNNIYVGIRGGATKVSRNSGFSWQNIAALWDISSIVIYPRDTNIIYASKANGQIYKSTDKGNTWSEKSISNSGFALGGAKTSSLAIDANNPNNLYLGMRNWYQGWDKSEIFKTTNGGSIWTNINRKLGNGFDKNNNPYMNAYLDSVTDVEMVAVDPTNFNTVYLADFWGMIRSIDGGNSWKVVSDGLQITGATEMVLDPNDNRKIYHTGGDAALFFSDDYGQHYRHIVVDAPGSYAQSWAIATANTNPTTIWYSSETDGWDGSSATYPARIRKSIDYGLTWTITQNGLPYVDRNQGSYPHVGGVTKIIVHPTNINTVFAAIKGRGIYKTTNAGGLWVKVLDGNALAMAMAPSNPNTLYVSGYNWVMKTIDGGNTWTSIPTNNNGLNEGTFDIAVHPTNPDIIYITTQLYVVKSTDGGRTWAKVYKANNPEWDYVYHPQPIKIDPNNPNRIFVGINGYRPHSGKGVYVSENAGSTWTQMNNGLPGKWSISLLYDSARDTLWSGTQTSTFKIQLSEASPVFDFSLSNSGGISVTQGSSATNTITSTLVSGSSQPVSFSVSGLPSGATYSFSPASCNPTCSTTLTISTSATTPAGTYTITITGTGGSVSKTTILSLIVTSLQTPYGGSSFAIPGTIQAENFDNGGEGVAYHDLDTSNNGGQYRSTGVDIEASSEGGYNIGWTYAGEWLEYSVSVSSAGSYVMNVRVASYGAGGTFHVEFDGVDKTGPISVPNTGNWQSWQTISKTVQLSAGNQIMRIVMDSIGSSGNIGNINYISFVAAPTCSSMSYPSDKWQRVWYKTSDNTCLGNGPDKASVKFDDNWGSGNIAYSSPDNVKFVSSRAIAFGAGSYRFTLGSDDGSRLYIDDALVINNWADQPYTTKTYTATWAASSSHNFRIEWYENAGLARISFDYASVDACGAANKIGIHTMVQDAGDIDQHLDWAKTLAGSGGYVKQLFYPVTTSTQGPQQRWIDFVNKAYQRDLIPIIRLEGDCCWIKPDSSNSYQNIAQAFKKVVQGLPKSDKYPLYIEVWNEPNLNGEWSGSSNPTEYANFHVAVYNAIKTIGDSRIKVLNGALAPGSSNGKKSYEWLEDALNANSGLKDSFDVWASHPYAGNHPPEYSNGKTPSNTNDNYHIKGYEWELAKLQSHGRSNVNVIATEAGYQYGNRDDTNYVAIDENSRADFTVRAFRDYWIPDSKVIAVTPFEMLDPNNQVQWQSWNWLNNDGTSKRVYTDVKNFRTACGSIFGPASFQYGIQIDVQASEKIPSTSQFQVLNPAWARYVYRLSNPFPAFPSGVNRLVIFNGESAPSAPHGSTDVIVWRNYVDNTYLPGLNAMLTSYPGTAAIEIWNEEDICPDITTFCPGIPAQAYAYMLKKAAAAIKAKDSSIKVIMGGLASGQASYITDVINADSLAFGQVDAVGLHPYDKSPDGWCASGCSVSLPFGDLAASVNEYKNAASLPIWVTEIGQGTTDRNWQADYLTRVFNVLSNNNVPVVIWYAWIDSMTGGDGANTWGLYDTSGSIKPSGTAFRAFTIGTKLYTSPEPSSTNSDITLTATSDIGCAHVGVTSAGFSNCRNLQCCSNPTGDGNQYGWQWTCTASSSAGTYTAAFAGDQAGCSATRSFTVQAADTTPPTTSIVSVEGDTSAPYADNTDNSKTDIIINGESGMACRIYNTDIAYSDSSGTLCTVSGTQATCTVSTANGNSYTRYITCKDSIGNGQSASQNLDVAWAVRYQCSDGTNYGQCSLTKPKYCDSGSLVNKCSVCGCSPVQVCQNENCVTQSSSLDRITVIMTKLANFAIPIKVELYNADNNVLLGSAVVGFGQTPSFDVRKTDFKDAGGNSIEVDRSVYPRLYILFKSPILFGAKRFDVP